MPDFINHSSLIHRMKKLGYRSSSEGICHGIAHMGMQAILIDEMNQFDNRLQKIADIPLDNLNEHPDLTKEILPFFDGVELYQTPNIYPFLFEKDKVPRHQDAFLASPLVLSGKIQEKGVLCKIQLACGAYTPNELKDYFDLIMNEILSKNVEPLALIIHFSNHCIAIGYDPQKHQWLFIDANQLPSKKFLKDDTKALAEHLFYVYNTPMTHQVIISTELYRIKSNEKQFRPLVKNLNQNKAWVQLHSTTSDKAKLIDQDGTTWLNLAAKYGYIRVVKELLAKKSMINKADNQGWTPLSCAVKRGHIEVVKELIAKGAQVNKTTIYGATPLHMAVQNGHVKTVKILLAKGADANKALDIEADATPLFIAAQIGNIKIVKMLLAKGADVNKALNNGLTPLFIAAQYGHVEIVKMLLAKGADVNKALNNGATPLIIAALGGHVEVVKILLEKGADVNKARNNGSTSLFIAADCGYVKLVKVLLENGADVNKALNNGATPLFMAVQSGHVELVTMLLESGADVNKVLDNGTTPLFMAALSGHVELVTMLLEKGADVDKACNNGITPLFIAAQNGHVELVKMLLAKGADVNKARNESTTPLFMAAQCGHVEVVELLLAAQANTSIHFKSTVNNLRQWASEKNVTKAMEKLLAQKNATEELSISPLEIATVMGHINIITLLKNTSNVPCNSSGLGFFSKSDSLSIEQNNVTPENATVNFTAVNGCVIL